MIFVSMCVVAHASVCVYVCLGAQRDACVLPRHIRIKVCIRTMYGYTHIHVWSHARIHPRNTRTYMCPDQHHLNQENPKWCTKKKKPQMLHMDKASKMRTRKGTPTTLFILQHQSTIKIFSLPNTNTFFNLRTHTRPPDLIYYTNTSTLLTIPQTTQKRQHY